MKKVLMPILLSGSLAFSVFITGCGNSLQTAEHVNNSMSTRSAQLALNAAALPQTYETVTISNILPVCHDDDSIPAGLLPNTLTPEELKTFIDNGQCVPNKNFLLQEKISRLFEVVKQSIDASGKPVLDKNGKPIYQITNLNLDSYNSDIMELRSIQKARESFLFSQTPSPHIVAELYNLLRSDLLTEFVSNFVYNYELNYISSQSKAEYTLSGEISDQNDEMNDLISAIVALIPQQFQNEKTDDLINALKKLSSDENKATQKMDLFAAVRTLQDFPSYPVFFPASDNHMLVIKTSDDSTEANTFANLIDKNGTKTPIPFNLLPVQFSSDVKSSPFLILSENLKNGGGFWESIGNFFTSIGDFFINITADCIDKIATAAAGPNNNYSVSYRSWKENRDFTSTEQGAGDAMADAIGGYFGEGPKAANDQAGNIAYYAFRFFSNIIMEI